MSITFDDGTNTVTLPNPEYGYKSIVSIPVEHSGRGDGTVGIYDAGTGYDRRVCESLTFYLTATQQNNFNTIFSDSSKGRGADVELQVGISSGFFPFGPDYGDDGNFDVRIIEIDQTENRHRPWNLFRTDIKMQMISNPAFAVVDDLDDGTVQFGTVTGVKYPQAGYNADVVYAIDHAVTMDGTAYEIDRSTDADIYEADFDISGNAGKIGSLLNYLLSTTPRNNNYEFSAIFPSGTYPFGRDKGAGTHTVQCLNKTFEITHPSFDLFAFPLRLRWVS